MPTLKRLGTVLEQLYNTSSIIADSIETFDETHIAEARKMGYVEVLRIQNKFNEWMNPEELLDATLEFEKEIILNPRTIQ